METANIDLLTIIRDELRAQLAESTSSEDIEYVAQAIMSKLNGRWVQIAYQARVKKGVKLNMREEPSTKAKIDGQLFETAVVSVINPEPEGPDEFVSVVYIAFASRKSLNKINDG